MIAAGQAESASRIGDSGTIRSELTGRAGRAASARTASPRLRCSTAEISRSMYIAASTIATAPTAA